MTDAPDILETRVLVLTPTGADAKNSCDLLCNHSLCCEAVRDLEHLCREAGRGAGVLLIAEEALSGIGLPILSRFLADQPSWSDLPIVVFTSAMRANKHAEKLMTMLGSVGNVTLLERPFLPATLISTIRVNLRARHRQYQVRTLLDEQRADREKLQRHAGELELKVAQRTAQLEETIAELEAFSYSVSHDLRAPLRAMQGYSFFLLEDYRNTLPKEGLDYVQKIIGAANRLDVLIQDVLTYSRVTRSDLEVAEIDPRHLIAEVIEHYVGFQPPHAEIELPVTMEPVMAHAGSLTQCVSNLLGNAVKFVEPGVVPKVRISSETVDGMIRINFQDNGIGISADHQSRIFKMFERAPHVQSFDGTGIGLAIVKKAVERMRGRVGVKSAPGEGSLFWIELPKG